MMFREATKKMSVGWIVARWKLNLRISGQGQKLTKVEPGY